MKEKGKSKKWIIALAILVLLAVVAVIIVVFLPKNTDDVKRQTHTQVDTMFLKSETDEKLYLSFEEKIKKHTSQYVNEAESVRKINVIISNVIEFYDSYIVYAENNGTFQGNYNLIMDGYKHANEFQVKMTNIITEVYEKIETSSTFTEGAWIDFKKEFAGYITGYANAIHGLNNVFRDCVPDGVLHNDLMFLILNTIDDYFDVIIEKGIVNKFVVNYAYNFVDKYLSFNTTPALSYKYNNELQSSVKLINSFNSVYGETESIKNIVQSIDASGITYKVASNDDKGILAEIKTFLNGGLKNEK